MTANNDAKIKDIVVSALSDIAPEVDAASLDPTKDLRDQIDVDSVDFLNFVIALHKQFNIEIPDVDVAKLTTIKGCVDYLAARTKPA